MFKSIRPSRPAPHSGRPIVDTLEHRRLLAVLNFTIDSTKSKLEASGGVESSEGFFNDIYDASYNNPAIVIGNIRAEVGSNGIAFPGGSLLDLVPGGINSVDPNLPSSDYAFFTELGDTLTMLYKDINLDLTGNAVREQSSFGTGRLSSRITAGTLDYILGSTSKSRTMKEQSAALAQDNATVTITNGIVGLEIPVALRYEFTLDGTSSDMGVITNVFTLTGTIFANASLGPVRFVSGTVVNDQSDDGIWQDGEVGLSRRTVYLDFNNNRRIDDTEYVTETDTRGRYRFDNVPVGTYSVRLKGQEGWRNTSPLSGTHTITLTNDKNAPNRNFLVTKRGMIGGNVFFDQNRNGTKQRSETRHVSQVVYLDTNNNAVLDEAEPRATTTPNGEYAFNKLAPGQYVVRLQPQPGMRVTTVNKGVARVNVSEGGSVRVDRFGIYIAEEQVTGFAQADRAGAIRDSVKTRRIDIDDLTML